MYRLMLLRHAKADRPVGVPDPQRPLNTRGVAAARLIGSYLARHGLVPDLVLCSPATRTRDTLDAVMAHWPPTVRVVFEDRLFLAAARSILALIRAQQKQVAQLMVIGHNPGLHEAAELLIASGDVVLRERLREKFPTGALAMIDFAVEDWSKVHNHSGRLDRFVTPRSIAAETN